MSKPSPEAILLLQKYTKVQIAEQVIELEAINAAQAQTIKAAHIRTAEISTRHNDLKSELKERTNQYHLAHAKILSREAINEDLAGEWRVMKAMLDTAYHLRFVDDTSTREEQMEFWKDVEKVIKEE